MPKIKWAGGALLAPVPSVLVTCGDLSGEYNVFTVAWTGMLSSKPPKTYVSVRPSRHSHHLLTETREFAVNLPPSSLVRQVDYCGVFTGGKVDKFEKCRFTAEAATELKCPVIAECPVNIECRVTEIVPLGSHDMFIADIVAVTVDDSLLDAAGKLRLERAGLIAYSHGEYFTLGRRIGAFGFSAAKKRAKPGGKNGGK